MIPLKNHCLCVRSFSKTLSSDANNTLTISPFFSPFPYINKFLCTVWWVTATAWRIVSECEWRKPLVLFQYPLLLSTLYGLSPKTKSITNAPNEPTNPNPNPTLFPVRGFSWRTSTILKTTTTKKKRHVDPLNPPITMMNSGRLGLVLAKIALLITRYIYRASLFILSPQYYVIRN